MLKEHSVVSIGFITTVALFLAIGTATLRQVLFPTLHAWQSALAATLLCVWIAVLLNLALLSREAHRQDEFLQNIIGKFPELACVIDDAGRFKRWNSSLQATIGYTDQEIAGITLLDTIAEEHRERVQQTITKAVTVGMAKVESVLVSRDGARIPCLFTGVRIVVNNRPCVLGIVVDLRHLRQAEESLRASEEQYRSLVASIPDIVWRADAMGNVSFVGPRVEAVLGYSVAEVYEQGDSVWHNSIHVDDRQRVRRAFQALIDEATRYDVECRVQRKTGEWLWMHDRAVVASDSNGVRFATGLLSDITERKEAEETLRKLASIVQFSQDAIVGKRMDGVITSWNRGAERMYGYTAAEAIGQNLSFLFSSGREDEMEAIMERIQGGQSIENLETERLTKARVLLDVSVSISPIEDATGEITGASSIARNIAPRKRAEEQLKLLSAALEAAANGIVITNYEGTIVWVNRAFTIMTGYSKQEALGSNANLWKSGEQPESFYADVWSAISSGKVWQGEIISGRKDKTTFSQEITITPVTQDTADPANRHFIAIMQDVTDRKLLQDQLQQAHKMEAIGRLAGGVAHDFNNMLGIISGYSELLKSECLRVDGGIDQTRFRYADQIHSTAKKAAALTQQLLAFSRKQIIQPRVLDLNEVIATLANMLRRLIGDDVELVMRFAPRDVLVKADQGQIEQVILNLSANARDAMPQGGKLTIETDVCQLDQASQIRRGPVVAGRYVRLAISDTGAGMDQSTISHLFEPFFTTKELGKGTGLGLSIVYGIVKQSDGYVWVYSEPGHGTAFKIYLPLSLLPADPAHVLPVVEPLGGSETILLVEDNQELRSLVAKFLTGRGYSIVESAGGKAALAMVAKQSVAVQVLITDIMMPGMNGRELANQLRETVPHLRVLYISGFTPDGAVQMKTLAHGEAFLQKPFALADLSTKIREIIDVTDESALAQATGSQS
jgi:two-component system, cell cycle sensor histidine kinase and response regulator CckA